MHYPRAPTLEPCNRQRAPTPEPARKSFFRSWLLSRPFVSVFPVTCVVVRRCPLFAVTSWEARCGLRLLSQFGRFTWLGSVTDGTGTTAARSISFFSVSVTAYHFHTLRPTCGLLHGPCRETKTTAIRLPRWSSYDLFEIDIFVSSTCILDIITLVPCARVCSLPSVTHLRPSGVYSGSPSDSR